MNTASIRENKAYIAFLFVTSLVIHLWLILHSDLGFIWFGMFVLLSSLGAVAVRLIIATAFDWIYILVIFVGVTVLEAVILYRQHEASSYAFLVICVVMHNGTGICLLHLQPDQQGGLLSYVLVPKVIGIFSRSAEQEYAWLTKILKSNFSVFPFYVSNTNFQDFTKATSHCQFAILYHSKTRGRVNITDVTDSLYDHELEHLSQTLGKSRVVVVVDDLDDSSWETKHRILENQPSISRLGQDPFLFTRSDKQSPHLRSNVEPLMELIRSA